MRNGPALTTAPKTRSVRSIAHDCLADPNKDAREALIALSKNFDVNTRERRPWLSTLWAYAKKLPTGAKVNDMNPQIVDGCLRFLTEA